MTIQEWFDKRKEAQIERRTREAKMEAESVPDRKSVGRERVC